MRLFCRRERTQCARRAYITFVRQEVLHGALRVGTKQMTYGDRIKSRASKVYHTLGERLEEIKGRRTGHPVLDSIQIQFGLK